MYNDLNPHVIGVVLKEVVRRAIIAIRNMRVAFEVNTKPDYDGKPNNDFVTSADKASQEIYVKILKECFPGYGIIAEEQLLCLQSSLPDGEDLYFTVDPLDGTKAFIRKQSFGIGTMVALIHNGVVISAYVGDIMTQEVFGFRPESSKFHRISEFQNSEDLSINPKLILAKQKVLLQESPYKHSEFVNELVCDPKNGGLFKGIEIMSGSIGTNAARLWKGEMGAMVLHRGNITPWDSAPVIGGFKKLGFVFLKVENNRLKIIEPEIRKSIYKVDYERLIVHSSRLQELSPFMG